MFFNRMSASAYLRDHGNAMFYTAGLLAHLERNGTRVINGFDAYQIETSKAAATRSVETAWSEISAKTRVVNSLSKIGEAIEELRFPLVFKPNVGGGAGIVKFDTRDELLTAAESGALDLGIDSTALLQEFVPKRGEHINRVETLAGKVLYAVGSIRKARTLTFARQRSARSIVGESRERGRGTLRC